MSYFAGFLHAQGHRLQPRQSKWDQLVNAYRLLCACTNHVQQHHAWQVAHATYAAVQLV